MALWLKQSTAKVVSFGPFLDRTDGVTEETGLVSALDHGTTGIKLSKNGGALTIRHASVTATTYDAYGMYRVTLDTTDTNTLGTLRMAFNEAATCLPVWQDFMVLPANIFDSLVSGSDLIDVSMTQILGTAVSSPATAGVLDVNLKNIANAAVSASTAQLGVNLVNIAGAAVSTSTAQLGVNAVQAGATAWNSGAIKTTSFTAGAIDAAAIADNAIDAGAIAADAITAAKIAAGAIDNATFAADVGSTAYATNIIALAADKAIANAALATAANLAAAKTVVDAVKVKTDYLPSATAGAAGGVFIAGSNAATSITTALTANITGNLSGSVGSVSGAVGSVTGAVGSVTGAVGSVTGNVGGNVVGAVGSVTAAVTLPTIPTNWITANGIATDAFGALELATDAAAEIAAAISIPSAATIASQVRTELTTELGRIDVATSTRLATAGYTAPLDAAGTRTAVGLATANLDTQLGDLPTAAENATALLDAANGVETGLTPREALRLTSAALAGKISGAETTTVVIRNTADTKDRITATVDADGNRTAITTDLT